MKKFNFIVCIVSIIFLIFFTNENKVYAKVNNANMNESSNEIINSQLNSLNISSFLKETKNYQTDILDDVDLAKLVNQAISGNVDKTKIYENIFEKLKKEFFSGVGVIASVIVIVLIHSFLKNISTELENNSSISKITDFVTYILIVSIVMKNFSEVINLIKSTIENLTGFINCLLPILITLITTTGSIASATMLEPTIMMVATITANIITKFIIPLSLISLALSVISNVSDKVQISKLSKFINSSAVWILGIILTFFVGIVSLEGSLTSSVDGLTVKTTKATMSGIVPVVGKILGDAVDTVIGCTNILKNAVGIIGVIIIIAICISPIIKLLFLMLFYYIGSALCEPIADEKIVNLLEKIGSTFKLFLGIMVSVSTLFIIGITLVINISNSAIMIG